MLIRILALSALFLSGCSTYRIPEYIAQVDNRSLLSGSTHQLKVIAKPSSFEDTGSIFCRGAGLVSVNEGKPFSTYIVNALKAELLTEGIYSESATEELSLTLSYVGFSSSMGATNWYIDATYAIGNRSVPVSTVYNDRSSYFGETACNNMAIYFPKAVKAHLNQLYSTSLMVNLLDRRTHSQPVSLSVKLEELQKALNSGLITKDEYETKRKEILKGF